MKVCLIFREARPGYFSIEEVFNCIRKELQDKVEFVEFYADAKRGRFLNILAARKVKADVYHITGDCNYIALGLPGKKTILTVHDIGHYERTLKGIRRILFGWLWWRFPLRRVQLVTVVSQFSKARLEKVFNTPAAKMKVIYNPIFPGFESKTDSFNKAYPRILQIGTGANKNTERLIEAVAGIPCHLVLINKLTPALQLQLEKAGVSYEIHNKLTQQEVQALYQSADILFFASLYEGFGLPIIEGFSTRIAVITGKVTSMPEIARDAAVLVDPWSIKQIRQAILTITNDDDFRQRLIERGIERVKDFQPVTIAEQYHQQYKQVYHQSR
jgi:glycosyltransferase involved in cell wall biosynthesis